MFAHESPSSCSLVFRWFFVLRNTVHWTGLHRGYPISFVGRPVTCEDGPGTVIDEHTPTHTVVLLFLIVWMFRLFISVCQSPASAHIHCSHHKYVILMHFVFSLRSFAELGKSTITIIGTYFCLTRNVSANANTRLRSTIQLLLVLAGVHYHTWQHIVIHCSLASQPAEHLFTNMPNRRFRERLDNSLHIRG